MPCAIMYLEDDIRRARVEMAEQGWSPEDIKLMEQEVELAKRKAEAESYKRGDTRADQLRAMERAVKETVAELHDREHRKLADAAKEIKNLAEFRKKNPGHHYNPNRVKVTPGGEEEKE